MRWLTFAIFAFIMLALEAGLRPLLHINAGLGWVCPSFLMILAAFVAMWAPASVVLWSMLILGVLVDLLPLQVNDGINVTPILGPATLGFMLGGFAVLRVRGLLYRDSILAVPAAVVVAGIFINLVTVMLLTSRGIALPFLSSPIPNWNTADQLFHRCLQLVYTAILAIPLGYLLRYCQRLFGFENVSGFGSRRA